MVNPPERPHHHARRLVFNPVRFLPLLCCGTLSLKLCAEWSSERTKQRTKCWSMIVVCNGDWWPSRAGLSLKPHWTRGLRSLEVIMWPSCISWRERDGLIYVVSLENRQWWTRMGNNNNAMRGRYTAEANGRKLRIHLRLVQRQWMGSVVAKLRFLRVFSCLLHQRTSSRQLLSMWGYVSQRESGR